MSKTKYKGKGFSGIKSGSFERKNWDAQLEPVRWTSQYADKTTAVRFVSDLFPVATHWVYTSLEDLGKNAYSESLVGKKFMVTCPDWNPEEESSSKTSCYICKHLTNKEHLGRANIMWYVQAFVAKKKDGKLKWSDEPIILILPTTAVTEIKTMMETVGNGVEPNDRKHGYSIWLTYKNGGAGKSSWSAQKDKEVSFKELGFSKDDIIDFGEYFEPTPAKDIDETMERLGYVDFIENGGKKKKKSKSIDDDEDEDDSDVIDEDEDDEDDEPKNKKKSKKSKEEDEDDDVDDDDDNEDDDEDEDDEKPSKKKKKNKFEDDEDEEDDDDVDDDEDEEDEDEDDDDDDDENEKPSKKKKKSKKFDDEDDEDDDDDEDDNDEDDDEDDDDDDEDEKPSKKKKKSKKFDDEDDDDDDEPKKKKKKKSKKFDDEDDDD